MLLNPSYERIGSQPVASTDLNSFSFNFFVRGYHVYMVQQRAQLLDDSLSLAANSVSIEQ